MGWVTFQGTGFKNRISGGVYTEFSIFTLCCHHTVSNRKSVSSGRGTGINSKHKPGVYLHIINILQHLQCLKFIELVNSIIFVILVLGRALLILSGYLTTQCGYTYTVRLVKLLGRSHGDAVVSLWGGSTKYYDESGVCRVNFH
jgi:hypothetical protein